MLTSFSINQGDHQWILGIHPPRMVRAFVEVIQISHLDESRILTKMPADDLSRPKK